MKNVEEIYEDSEFKNEDFRKVLKDFHDGKICSPGLRVFCAIVNMEKHINKLESENIRLKSVVSKLETTQPKWHQCEHPDSESFYDLPPESGEYIVQVRSRSGRLETFAAEFDADYSDWPELINGTVVIQWCEEPKPSSKTQTAKSKERKDNFFKNKTLTKTNK